MRLICPECQKQFNSLLVSPLEALTEAGLAVSKHIQKAHSNGQLMQDTRIALAKLMLMINEFLPMAQLGISSNGPAWDSHAEFAFEYKERLAFDIVKALDVEKLLGFTLPDLVTPRLDEYRKAGQTTMPAEVKVLPDVPPESTQ